MMDEWWLDGVSLSLAAVKMMGVGVSWFDGHPARHFHFDGQTLKMGAISFDFMKYRRLDRSR